MSVDPNLNLANAQALVCSNITNCNEALAFGYFTYQSFEWQCDATSRTNIIGVIVMAMLNGGNLPPGFPFRDASNTTHTVTGLFMYGMGESMLRFISTSYNASWTHKANVMALTDPIAVQEYDYMSSLWPNPNVQY